MKIISALFLTIILSGCASYNEEHKKDGTYLVVEGIPDPMYIYYKTEQMCKYGAKNIASGRKQDGTQFLKYKCLEKGELKSDKEISDIK